MMHRNSHQRTYPLSPSLPSQKPRNNMERTNMDEKVEKKVKGMNVKQQGIIIRQIRMVELNMNEIKKNSHMMVSPTSSEPAMRKSSSDRWNCLCSSTTHVGSFRCRCHRAAAGIHHARSIDSNLSEIASKQPLHPQ